MKNSNTDGKRSDAKSTKRSVAESISISVTLLDTAKTCYARYHNTPYMVAWPGADGKRDRKFFPTEGAANKFRDAMFEAFEAGISLDEMREAARIAKGTGYTVPLLCLMGLEHLRDSKTTGVNPAALLKDGADKSLQKAIEKRDKTLAKAKAKIERTSRIVISQSEIEKEAKLSKTYRRAVETVNTIRSKMNRIFPGDEKSNPIPGLGFNFKAAKTISAEDVTMFLNSLPDRNGKAGRAAGWTRICYVAMIHRFLLALGIKNAKIQELIKEEKASAEEDHEVEIFENDEVRAMFREACDEERGHLALCVIGGLRPELVAELDPAFINMRAGTITISEKLAKDDHGHILGKEHRRPDGVILPGLPLRLFEWLAKYPFVPQKARGFCERMTFALQQNAGDNCSRVKWIPDGLRHTAASNYNAYFGEAATAKFLTHAGESLLFKHYVKPLPPEHADDFYSISPSDFPSRTRADVAREKDERKRKAGITVVKWPSDEELARLVWTSPVVLVAKALGCSDPAVHRRCKKRGIKMHPMGYWQQVRFGQTQTKGA